MRRYPAACIRLRFLAAALAAAAAAPGPAEARTQGEAPPPVGEFTESVAVPWVMVPVVVRGPRGYVRGLERGDFRLYVDGERVDFPDFESDAETPVSLVVLQDLSGSMANGGKLAASRRALGQLLDRARPLDEMALATFAGGELTVDVPFTGSEEVLRESMELWEGYGTTAIHDAVASIPEIGAEGRHPKRAVVLVSDGVDNASVLAPGEAREVVREARLPVYVVALGRGPVANGNGADGVRRGPSGARGTASDSYGALLRRLAVETGGRYFPVRRPGEIAPAVAALLDELRQQYVLAFPAAPGPSAPRRLEVRVAVPGRVAVTHRRGYVGGPPA